MYMYDSFFFFLSKFNARSNLISKYKSNMFFPIVDKVVFLVLYNLYWGRRGRDRMVIGFTTTYAISGYHH